MSIPFQRIRVALMSVLCAAALLFPTWAAYAVEAGSEAVAAPPENDAFYGYLLQRAGVSDGANLLSDAGSRLSAKDRELYEKLKAMIVQVAAGERTSSVFEITYENFQTTWTAAELGVSEIIAGDEISDEAADALFEKMELCFMTSPKTSPGAIINALLSDCPYELYWFDKTQDYSYGMENSVGARNNGSGWVMTADSTLSYTFTFSVSQNYGSGTTVNRNLRSGIENTVANATAIVSKYQGKSDYDKLLGYSTEICNLVKYHDEAGSENTTIPYGDPWQLISVFDNDPGTDVVCEGYSKAFKYLCDLTAFNSSNVECYVVTGNLSEGTGAGGHMWNLVTMDNGKRYLVDVTNSDGKTPDPGYLFLKGGTPDSADSSTYTFYDSLSFTYDEDTLNFWGDDFLTLDTADYKDAAPASDPGTSSAYAYEVQGLTRSGTSLTVDLKNNSGDGALLMVATYAENGQFLRVALDSTQTANIARGTSGSVSLQLDTGDADTVKVILLDNDTQKPLCESKPYRFQ